ncbi:MAG: hypothetical protein M1826_004151 [Phylliscum demangeonii]|nr:MAG: hypothetical protein M1826_004151 [Phylliscum demangeonii]
MSSTSAIKAVAAVAIAGLALAAASFPLGNTTRLGGVGGREEKKKDGKEDENVEHDREKKAEESTTSVQPVNQSPHSPVQTERG